MKQNEYDKNIKSTKYEPIKIYDDNHIIFIPYHTNVHIYDIKIYGEFVRHDNHIYSLSYERT